MLSKIELQVNKVCSFRTNLTKWYSIRYMGSDWCEDITTMERMGQWMNHVFWVGDLIDDKIPQQVCYWQEESVIGTNKDLFFCGNN